MTLLVIISVVLMVGSLIGLIWLLAPKLSTLSRIDVEAIPHERNVKAKDKILYDRLRRRIQDWEHFFSFVIKPLSDFFKQFSQALAHTYKRLSDAREFQKKQWTKFSSAPSVESVDSADYQQCMSEAERLFEDEKFSEAEMKYIDLISKNKDGLTPYHGLISVYTAQKEWEKARDVAEYLVKVYSAKLKKGDVESTLIFDAAQNSAELADVYCKLENYEKASQSIRRSLNWQPLNPKYLDAGIEIAILTQQRLKAEKYLEQLRDANPENQKIQDFEERIKQLQY
ncbi:MAG: hypothetical protein AAB400_02745 [Patescibacteria group bacterium]